MKIFVCSLSILLTAMYMHNLCAEANTEEAKPDPKKVTLSVKKRIRKKKVKYKTPPPARKGSDFDQDDVTEEVKIIVSVTNRNKIPLSEYSISGELYTLSATDKKADPEVALEISADIKSLEQRKKFTKTFEMSTSYDKNDDIIERHEYIARINGKVLTDAQKQLRKIYITTEAFGKYFLGYKIDLKDADGNIIRTIIKPSKLKRLLKKMQKEEKSKK